ncbi:hypothetical protein [Marisediminicola sp. LYQ85]|uniref:hypothetical protein n=1 Tax=Marisediminicola sp. LYQ85 TaxID=3391062 RepID=UPI0039834E19
MNAFEIVTVLIGVALLVAGSVLIARQRRRVGPPLTNREATITIVLFAAGGSLTTIALANAFIL